MSNRESRETQSEYRMTDRIFYEKGCDERKGKVEVKEIEKERGWRGILCQLV